MPDSIPRVAPPFAVYSPEPIFTVVSLRSSMLPLLSSCTSVPTATVASLTAVMLKDTVAVELIFSCAALPAGMASRLSACV